MPKDNLCACRCGSTATLTTDYFLASEIISIVKIAETLHFENQVTRTAI